MGHTSNGLDLVPDLHLGSRYEDWLVSFPTLGEDSGCFDDVLIFKFLYKCPRPVNPIHSVQQRNSIALKFMDLV